VCAQINAADVARGVQRENVRVRESDRFLDEKNRRIVASARASLQILSSEFSHPCNKPRARASRAQSMWCAGGLVTGRARLRSQ